MKKFRLFFDKDEEQNWLQAMANEGWAFERFFLGVYTFAPCEPGEFIYQIDLLNNWYGDRQDFSAFMEDSGVEVVSQWYRWVFLRKKAELGPFEMYTDRESKLAQYRRIRGFFLAGLVVEIICTWTEANAAIRSGSGVFWMFTLLLGFIAFAMLRIVWKCNWKIEQLARGR